MLVGGGGCFPTIPPGATPGCLVAELIEKAFLGLFTGLNRKSAYFAFTLEN